MRGGLARRRGGKGAEFSITHLSYHLFFSTLLVIFWRIKTKSVSPGRSISSLDQTTAYTAMMRWEMGGVWSFRWMYRYADILLPVGHGISMGLGIGTMK